MTGASIQNKIEHYFFNGAFYNQEDKTLTPYDLGMLRGYGIFDFMKIVDGVPVFKEDHIDRFFDSAKAMDLAVPYNKEEIFSFIDQLIAKNRVGYSGVRLVLTGGFSESGFQSTNPNFFILQHVLQENNPKLFTDGVKLITADYVRDVPKIKTLNYSYVLKDQKRIHDEGAFDLLFVKEDMISESSRSNFFVIKNKTLITSSTGVLHGITRKKILSLAEGVMNVEIRPISHKEVLSSEGAFLCGTTKPLVPVTQLDDDKINKGRVLPLISKLRALYLAEQDRYIKSSVLTT
jgi:branched-subunit amino acid aminotransferase/4-amino-4-deoxychorismate lyase